MMIYIVDDGVDDVCVKVKLSVVVVDATGATPVSGWTHDNPVHHV